MLWPLELLAREKDSSAELSSSEESVWPGAGDGQQRPVQESDGWCEWADGGAVRPVDEETS